MQPAKRDAIFNLEYAVRELRRKRGDVITIVSESIPITAIQCYTLMFADDIQMITILIVLFSSTVFGAKMAGLGAYHDVRMQRDEAPNELGLATRRAQGPDWRSHTHTHTHTHTRCLVVLQQLVARGVDAR